MTLPLVLLASLLLVLPGGGAAPVLRYLLTQPDGGEDTFWTWANHDTTAWRVPNNLADVGVAVREANAAEAWVRLEIDHTPATLNNGYFRIRHSGPIEIYVNGLKRAGSPRAVAEKTPYRVSPRRPERLGSNVYAIHFRHDAAGPALLEIKYVNDAWRSTDDGALRPAAVLPDTIRDAQVCRGGDGAYYLTGTTGDAAFLQPGPDSWLRNPGIEVFRSSDLVEWKSLGWVWTFERDGTWNKEFGKFGGRGPARGIFAPEIHFLKGKYWLVYSVNHTTASHRFGIGLLQADQPQGPWREMSPEQPITDGFDANLFADDDGSVYLLKHGGEIARLKPDMTGLAEPLRALAAENYPNVGYEGVCLFKQDGRYYLTAAEWNVHADGGQSYDSMVASSSNIHGPYGPRYAAIRFGGHNGWFQDGAGKWNATVWCYPDHDPHWQKVSILPMEFGPDGLFRPARP